MANTTVDRFFKSIAGNVNDIADFTGVILPTGDFNRITGINAVLNSWNNILLTPLGTYTWDPDFGSELYKYVFELADDHTIEMIRHEIEYRLMRNDDRAQIIDIVIEMFSNGKGFRYSVLVKYKGTSGTLSGTIDEKTALNFMEPI